MLNPLSFLSGYLWYAVLALALALASTGWLLKRSYVANGAVKAELNAATDALEDANSARALDRATLTRLTARRAATARAAASATASLGAAQVANRPWADTPVPKEVQDALR